MFLFARAIIFQQGDMEEFNETQFSSLSTKMIDASFRWRQEHVEGSGKASIR